MASRDEGLYCVGNGNEDMTVENPTNQDQPPVEPELAGQYSITVAQADVSSTLPVSIMRFTGIGVVPEQWKGCRMVRDFKRPSKVVETAGTTPTEGGGSEYCSEVRQEVQRRKKEKYRKKPLVKKDQPWLMRIKTEEEDQKKKRFRGTKVGGLTDNISYYIFILDGACVRAVPVTSLFDFKSIERYNNLTAEEAEETFQRRNQTYNYFSIMTRKRLRNEDSNEKENLKERDAKKLKYLPSASGRPNSEQEETHKWSDSSDEEGDGKKTGRKKKKGVTDEDDDDGESEREVDYMSSSSEASSDENGVEGTKAEEDEGHSQLLKSSDSESDEKSDE